MPAKALCSKSNGIQQSMASAGTDREAAGHSRRPRPGPHIDLHTDWGTPPRSRRGSSIWIESLQAWRQSEMAVASRRRPSQIPQVRAGATAERHTSSSSAAAAPELLLPPRPRRAEVPRGGGSRALLSSGRGSAVAGAEGPQDPRTIADVGWDRRWSRPWLLRVLLAAAAQCSCARTGRVCRVSNSIHFTYCVDSADRPRRIT